MAYKNFSNQLMTLSRSIVQFNMTIPTNGIHTPLGVKGAGFTVAKTNVGVYTLTPDAGLKFPVQLGVFAHLRLAAVGNTWAQVGTINTTTGVITVNCVTGLGVAVEWPAANADNVLSVEIVYSNSSQLPQH